MTFTCEEHLLNVEGGPHLTPRSDYAAIHTPTHTLIFGGCLSGGDVKVRSPPTLPPCLLSSVLNGNLATRARVVRLGSI